MENNKSIAHIYLFSFLNYVGILITMVMSLHNYDNLFDSIAIVAIPIIQFLLIFFTSFLYDSFSPNKLKKEDKYAYYILSVIMAIISMACFWIVWYWKLAPPQTDMSDHQIINSIMNTLLFPLGIILSELLPLDSGMGEVRDEVKNVKSKVSDISSALKLHLRLTINYVIITLAIVLLIIFFLINPATYTIIEIACDVLAVIVLLASLIILKKVFSSK